MKKLFILIIPVLFITACDDKEIFVPVHPVMRYTNLNDQSIKFGEHKALDLDGDNVQDILFSTMLVGDPVFRRDKRQYYASASFYVSVLVNGEEQTPPLNKNDSVKTAALAGYEWYNANSVLLAEKIIEEAGPAHWEGNWKNTDHKYLPVQIMKNNRRYNGWVELSFNTGTEEMILHHAAISTEAEKNIKAGTK